MRARALLCAALCLGSAYARDDDDDDESAEAQSYKEFWKLMNMTMEEIWGQFGKREPRFAPPPRQDKIDHFVVLYMENHAADHYFGCMGLEGFDGINGSHAFPLDPANASKGTVNVSCGAPPYICTGSPGYATFDGKFGPGGDPHAYPYGPQSDANSGLHGATTGGVATTLFSPEQIPVKRAVAAEFGVFNRLYTAVPSASSPNHLFTQSGTSCGMTTNTLYDSCGGNTSWFPQDTIYDRLRDHNISFGLFINSTCGLNGQDPCHGENQDDPNSASAISTPDVAMEGVARHKDMFFSQELFYGHAKNGTLPGFSWLHPPIEACDHPCNDIAKGERLLKDIYEALRAGPGWNRTLFFIVYDDAGGYYDHVVPPFEGVAADEAPCIVPGAHASCGPAFDFKRLGLRSSAMLISPLVPKGAVFQEPQQGPFATSQFDLTSILATTKNLFNLSSFLTKRDAWAGSFTELLLDEPRTDAPLHLPTPPMNVTPWEDVGGSEDGAARHCSSPHGAPEEACRAPTDVSRKQAGQLKLLAKLTASEPPEDPDFAEAAAWIQDKWAEWMAA